MTVSPNWIGIDCRRRMDESDILRGYHRLGLYRHPSGVFGVPWLTIYLRYPFVRINLGKRAWEAVSAARSIR